MTAERSNMTATTYQHGNATIVVYRPVDLSDKERKKREDNLCRAIALMGKAMNKRKEGR